jgi:quercetin dioxygenase-like cupin family protein
MKRLTLIVVALLVPTAVLAQGTEPAEHAVVVSEAVAFGPIEVPGFDPGMQIAVLHGDPNAETGDYTLRLKFPAGYRFPVHWHPMGEHLTVVSGSFLLGMGDTADDAAIQTYAPGDFIYIPGEHPHFGGAETETVIQLHGMNPFKIILPEAVSGN